MSAIASQNRRYAVAAGIVVLLALLGYALARFYPALGPIAGTVTPQLYVDSLPTADIPPRGRYILVDAASARLYMMEDGRVRDSMKVIVGKPESPTPALKSVINFETLNPYWHLEPDLAKSIIAPRVLSEGDAYLIRQGYQVVTGFGPNDHIVSPDSVDWKAVAAGQQQIYVRQQPGPANSLGHFKFDLHDGDGIYLHDTPKKELFAQDQRNLSHGCVRLEDAERLARWLLGKDPPPVSAPEQNVPLPQPVPVTISYLDAKAQLQLAALS